MDNNEVPTGDDESSPAIKKPEEVKTVAEKHEKTVKFEDESEHGDSE